MERQVVTTHQRLKRKSLTHKEVKSNYQNSHRSGRLPISMGGKSSRKKNQWTQKSTLNLLRKMKALVRKKKLPKVTKVDSWKAVASKLSNDHGLKLNELARSCQVKIDNIRRSLKRKERRNIAPEVRKSFEQYERMCQKSKNALRSRCAPLTGKKRFQLPLGSQCTPLTIEKTRQLPTDCEIESMDSSFHTAETGTKDEPIDSFQQPAQVQVTDFTAVDLSFPVIPILEHPAETSNKDDPINSLPKAAEVSITDVTVFDLSPTAIPLLEIGPGSLKRDSAERNTSSTGKRAKRSHRVIHRTQLRRVHQPTSSSPPVTRVSWMSRIPFKNTFTCVKDYIIHRLSL